MSFLKYKIYLILYSKQSLFLKHEIKKKHQDKINTLIALLRIYKSFPSISGWKNKSPQQINQKPTEYK